jgi:uncharacterized delta-60 repeat protein
MLGGQSRNHLGRLNADGGLDTNFTVGVSSPSFSAVKSLVVQTNGRVLVGGYFTTLGTQTRTNLGRLLADGTVDAAFNPGANNWVECFALQTDGRILVGGTFTALGGFPRSRLARLNDDGTLDASFDPAPNDKVSCVVVQADGQILVGGFFNTLCGVPRAFLGRVRADGTLDSSFDPQPVGPVDMIALEADGKILVAGGFTHIARLNSDGSLDAGFDLAANGDVRSLVLQADGRLILGGGFTSLAGQTRPRLARLNSDDTLDPNFNPGANAAVSALAIQADGKVLAGGLFTTLAGQSRNYLGRLTCSDPVLQTINLNATGTVLSWWRSGAAPELEDATFEMSTNGMAYTWLGRGVRVSGGWQLPGLSLPADTTFYVRASGRTVSGSYNASRGLVQAVQQFHYHAPPAIVSLPAAHAPGTFTLAGQGTPGLTYTVETSTNLAGWTTRTQLVADANGRFSFLDTVVSNRPAGFYRLRGP